MALFTPRFTPKHGLSSPAGYVALRGAISELHEEVIAIRQCLANAGLLSTQIFLAQLHRRRFARMCCTHPCAWESSLHTVLGGNELLGLNTMLFAGLLAAGVLRSTSRSMQLAVEMVGGTLEDSLTRLYVCGGADGNKALSSVERFDAEHGTWQTMPAMTQPRAAAASAMLGGRLYVCGGSDGQRELSDVERFSPLVGFWEPVPPLLHPRADAVAGVLSGRLCVVAGSHGHNIWGSAERFNPQLGTWEALRALKQPRSEACAGTLLGWLVVCGGNGDGHSREALSSVEGLDASGLWQQLPPLLQPRYGAAAVVVGQYLFVYGGHSGRQYLTSAERYNPTVGAWESIAPLLRPRAGMAAALLCGHVYLCGGYDGAAVRAVERCSNPQAAGATWEVLAPLSHDRASSVSAAISG